jgi:hypothetical protein
MLYYSSQLIETNHRLGTYACLLCQTMELSINGMFGLAGQSESISDEIRTRENISRMAEVIAAQTLPVCLVVTGDDLGMAGEREFVHLFTLVEISSRRYSAASTERIYSSCRSLSISPVLSCFSDTET